MQSKENKVSSLRNRSGQYRMQDSASKCYKDYKIHVQQEHGDKLQRHICDYEEENGYIIYDQITHAQIDTLQAHILKRNAASRLHEMKEPSFCGYKLITYFDDSLSCIVTSTVFKKNHLQELGWLHEEDNNGIQDIYYHNVKQRFVLYRCEA